MSTISKEHDQDVSADVEVVEEELAEVGKVSETKGGFFGFLPDVGNGFKNG